MKHILAKIFTSAMIVTAILGSFGPMQAAQAATANTLIKGSGSTVYWYASNGKRYVFPNIKTYWSWFATTQSINTVSDYELSQITLAGNITYRPGYKLVKVQTDPKVYAVSRYGVLHWVTSESVANTLYGWNWNTKVDDIPDTFFVNYTVGSPIWNASEYNVSNEYNGVSTPSDSINGLASTSYYNNTTIVSYPANYSSDLVFGVTNRTNSGSTETVTLTANLSGSSVYSNKIQNIFIYDEAGTMLANCPSSVSCSASMTNTQYSTRNVYARAYLTTGGYIESAHIQVAYGQTNNNNNNNYGYTNYALTTDRTSVNSGSTLTLNFTANNPSSQIMRIDIRDTRDNSLVTSCAYTNSCSATPTVYSRYGTTQDSVRYVANVYDYFSTLIVAQSSDTVTINGGSSNNNFTLNGSATISADRTTANVGDSVRLTVNAYTPNTTTGNVTIRVYDELNGTLVSTCAGSNYCTAYATIASNMNGRQVRYYAVVSDNYGNRLANVYTNSITIGQNNQQQTFTGTVSFIVDQTNVIGGQWNPNFNATVSNYNIAVQNMTIRLYNEANDTLVATCNGINTCNVTMPTVASTQSSTLRLYAVVTDTYGNQLSRVYSPIVTINPTQNQNQTTFTGTINVIVDRTSVVGGEWNPNFNATVSNYNIATQNMTIRLYNDATGALLATCNGINTCNVTMPTVASTQSSTIRLYAIVTDNNGNQLSRVYSPTVTVTPTQNQNQSTFTGTLAITTDKTGVYSGDPVTISATLSNSSVAAQNVTLDISRADGTAVRTCTGTYTCSATDTLWYWPGNTYQKYTVTAHDASGHSLPAVYTPAVVVAPSTKTDISVSNSSVAAGSTVTITASLDPSVGPSLGHLTTDIYRNDTNQIIGSCSDINTCSVTYPVGSAPMQTSFYAHFHGAHQFSLYSAYAPVLIWANM